MRPCGAAAVLIRRRSRRSRRDDRDYHGRGFGFGVRGDGDPGAAEPAEQRQDDRRDDEVDEDDDQGLRGSVAMEVDGVVQQEVGVAGRQEGPDSPPEPRKVGDPIDPPEEGLPNIMITMIVSSVPAAPTSFCSTAHTTAVTAMISEATGQTIQKLLVGYPPSHRPTIRSTTRPATVNERVRPVPQARPPDGTAVTLGWFRGAGTCAGPLAGAQDTSRTGSGGRAGGSRLAEVLSR